MIKPLVLGNKTFPVNLIQGPLAGVSCAPFRQLTWQYGKPAFSCTEMISSKTLVHAPRYLQQRFVQKAADEGPVCFQLSGNTVAELSEATKIATGYGADLIDLNCGCPMKKIRSKGAGSSLLSKPDELYPLIVALKRNTTVPVSVKIRVESTSGEKFNQAIADVVADAGADFLIVHGRHWTQHYETPCQHDQIQFFVETLKIPVIGNGDIACVHSLKKMLATGCAGVMIGRAGIGQPWLIQQLIAQLHQQPFKIPEPQEIGQMLRTHIMQLAKLLQSEKFAILQARKLAPYYARALKNNTLFCDKLNTCETLAHFCNLCEDYFCI